MIEQKDMIHAIEAEVHHELTIITPTPNSQNRYRSTSRERFSYDKNITPPQYTRSRYDNYTRDAHRSSYKSPYRHDSRHRYRSRSYSRNNNNLTRYTSSYRPSRPRDSRYSRSCSHSNTRNKPNTIQPQAQNDPINFEVNMYHTTEMANAVIPSSWFYSLYTHTSSNQILRDYASRLEILFLLNSGASISVLNYPTYVTIAKLINTKKQYTQSLKNVDCCKSDRSPHSTLCYSNFKRNNRR